MISRVFTGKRPMMASLAKHGSDRLILTSDNPRDEEPADILKDMIAGLTEAEQRPLGKYGRMRLRYLEEHRPGLYTRLLLSGKLMEHLQEIDSSCQERLEHMTRQKQVQEGVTEELKAENQMEWVQRMNAIHHQIEEILLTELVFA